MPMLGNYSAKTKGIMKKRNIFFQKNLSKTSNFRFKSKILAKFQNNTHD
jgi:hypothetical protein